jgi:hypothetical protein
MIIALSAVIGLAAAVLLLTAGYLFGVKRGVQVREGLRQQQLAQAQEASLLREQLSQRSAEQQENLRALMEQFLSPLTQRDPLAFELSNPDERSWRLDDLSRLLDQIADKGNFATVLLSDHQGLPLAANTHAQDLERLGATSSLLQLVADRLGSNGSPAPLSLMVHDAANAVTLCRMFKVGDHRLALTAVSPGILLLSTAIDPALVKVDRLLMAREHQESFAEVQEHS